MIILKNCFKSKKYIFLVDKFAGIKEWLCTKKERQKRLIVTLVHQQIFDTALNGWQNAVMIRC